MNLTEQLDQLRDGDIARAEFQPDASLTMTACEGPVATRFMNQRTVGGVYIEGSDNAPLLSVTILRPLLQPGDRVRWWRNSSLIGTVVRVDDVNASVVVGASKTAFTWLLTDCERLPAEPAPQPEPGRYCYICGRALDDSITWAFHQRLNVAVCGTCPMTDVMGEDITSHLMLWHHAQPTVEVGQWWADKTKVPHVVVHLNIDHVGVRSWLAPDGAWSWVSRRQMDADWTRLDGPPEPPVGAVVAVQFPESRVWQIAQREADGSWTMSGFGSGCYDWPTVLLGCDPSTLRVLAVLDGE